jgi:hypothetical protein
LELELNKPDPVSIPLTKEVDPEANNPEASVKIESTNETSWIPEQDVQETVAEKIVFDLEQPELPIVNQALPATTEFVEISSSMDQIPTTQLVEFSAPEVNNDPVDIVEKTIVELAPSAPIEAQTPPVVLSASATSGVVLEKPKQIYVEEAQPSTPVNTTTNPHTVEEPVAVQPTKPVVEFFDEEASEPLTLFVREHTTSESEMDMQENTASNNDILSEQGPIDENAELRRRANERLNKLRNLSFNVGSDPNSEFETVPAYMRRGLDVQVQLADVESFYSHYTVKPTTDQPIELNRFNKFLDGKKPD